MQEINLYQAQFKPKKLVLPPRQMLLIVLIVMAVLSVMSLYSAKRNTVLQTTIKQQQQYTTQNIAQSPESPLLLAELEKINVQQFDKQRLLDYLSHQDFGNQQGFSATLFHLAKQQIDNVWLTEFSLVKGGQSITLQGKASQSNQIPLYIDSLAKAEYFQGKSFSVFQLEQPKEDSNVYTFKLNTESSNKGGR